MTRQVPRLLQITHGHPSLTPGGTETVALALHRYWRTLDRDCWYLGAAEPQFARGHPGTNMVSLTPDNREAVIAVDGFDRFRLEQPDYFGCLREFANYLDFIKPEIIHFHHVLNFGLEALHVARATVPQARIVLTLHDYYLICASHGLLYKHGEGERCNGPSIASCSACIAGVTPADIRMRQLDVQSALTCVDLLIAPSHFLANRVQRALQNLPPLTVIENTYLGATPVASWPAKDSPYVFAFFGNLSRLKGVGDLLDAACILAAGNQQVFEVHLNGAQLYPDKELDSRISSAETVLGTRLVQRGRYGQDDFAARIANCHSVVFPSIWWENSPLVLFEAMAFGRPIICYPHGAAAEIVRSRKAGIISRETGPRYLADAMREMMTKRPGMGRTELPPLSKFAAAHDGVYRNPAPEHS